MDTTPPAGMLPGNAEGLKAIPDTLLNRMRADPLHAPELLALAAVDRFGPEARDWVAGYRSYYPDATPGQLAEVTRARFTQLSRYSGAVAGVAGGVGAVVDFGVLAWNQARMVLYFAAIYGEDPLDRDRAAELLTLQNVHKVIGTARTAIDVVARQAPPTELLRHGGGSFGMLAFALAKMAGMRVARRAVLKVVPLASIPLGAWANASSTKQLALRAVTFYSARARHRQLPSG